jgi:hypothetical protein
MSSLRMRSSSAELGRTRAPEPSFARFGDGSLKQEPLAQFSLSILEIGYAFLESEK